MHRWTIALQFLLSTLLLVPEAHGAIRYVAKSGTDNPSCALTFPCLTINHAVVIALPGDTISIGKGKFYEDYGVGIGMNLTINGAGTFSTQVRLGWHLPGQTPVFTIMPATTVTITRLDVMGGDAAAGGGIYNGGHLTLEYVRIWKNSATGGGGGISNGGTLLMSKSEIAHNDAYYGGGLYNHGIATLDQVRIVANRSVNLGGGIYNEDVLLGDFIPSSLVTMTGSEVSYNDPGGITNLSRMSLVNTTVSHNSAVGIISLPGADTELTHVTVAANGTNGPTILNVRGGLHVDAGSSVALMNTIVANNISMQCQLAAGASVSAATGSLIGDATCGSFWPDTLNGGVLVGVDPKLGPLKWNGGSTFTNALKAGSPAIDAGYPPLCTPVDQRGVLRAIDGNGDGVVNCDIGAFEYSPFKKVDK